MNSVDAALAAVAEAQAETAQRDSSREAYMRQERQAETEAAGPTVWVPGPHTPSWGGPAAYTEQPAADVEAQAGMWGAVSIPARGPCPGLRRARTGVHLPLGALVASSHAGADAGTDASDREDLADAKATCIIPSLANSPADSAARLRSKPLPS